MAWVQESIGQSRKEDVGVWYPPGGDVSLCAFSLLQFFDTIGLATQSKNVLYQINNTI